MILPVRTWGHGHHTVLLVHGLMADHRTWRRIGPELAARGHRVIAVDLRGHGAAPAATGRQGHRPEELAQDLVDTLPRGADLALGHSLGALALLLAADRLAPARAVYSDPAWVDLPRDLPALRAAKHASRADLRVLHPRWTQADLDDELDALAKWDPRSADALLACPGLPPAPGRASLVQLADPSRRIGSADAALLRARGYTVRVVPGAGHTIHRDDPEGFTASLEGWILPKPASPAKPAPARTAPAKRTPAQTTPARSDET
ncbi:alpha/beta fold hydrolase [Kitasatospora sp. NBC_00315]|uniref:alpha/beta fold hydrolase n=1 Tax=Kitasatospora sp. NBC_00315 TaxID=2975963 RepID=UPI00324C8D91